MGHSIDRREFLGMVSAAAVAPGASGRGEPTGAVATARGPSGSRDRPPSPYLTEAGAFVDVSRGNPKPYKLRGEALVKARLTAATWRLEVVGDGSSQVPRPCRLEDGTALDLAALRKLGETHGCQIPQSYAVQQHPRPAGPGAVGRGAAARGDPAGRTGGQRPAGLLLGLPQRRPGAALPVLAALRPRDGESPV